ncbi:MAG: hypothetical protein AMJ72_01500 [Acidithiobacillales bacterium SM1_46]|jgi:hypothetical protein|nr:MAG: hypothetical protein AMJ72_01500 [Acidithiobacillales bacterium SM1_46]
MPRLLLVLLIFFGAVAHAETAERTQVADPYIEFHTGPGRGYPIFHVVERGQWIEILKRHTDWFKVRSEQGKEGWVSRAQLERTLTEAGAEKTFRDVLVEDYLARRIEFGFSYGTFNRSDPIMTGFAGYRFTENLGLELSVGQSSGEFSSTRLIYASVVSQPAPDWVVSPYLSIGLGQFRNTPKSSLVGAIETNVDMATAAIGARYFLTRRFFVRADLRDHVALVNTNRTESYLEWSAGIGFFF